MRFLQNEAPCRASGEGAGITSANAITPRSVQQSSSDPQPGTRLPLPPYGRKLLALRAQGLAPTVAVLILDGWEPIVNLAEYAPWVLIIPDTEPAASFDFRCIAGLFAYVVAQRMARMDEIATHVLKYCPKGVCGWADELGSLAFYSGRQP